MVLGERRRRSVIAKLVELALALLVVLTPASALALMRAPLSENASPAAVAGPRTRVWGFDRTSTQNAPALRLACARNASGKFLYGPTERIRSRQQGRWFDEQTGLYDFRNRVWSPEFGALLEPRPQIFRNGVPQFRCCDRA